MSTHILGQKLRFLRGEAGFSVRDAAQSLGKSPGYISRIEARGELPSVELIHALAVLYKADQMELLELWKQQQLKTFKQELERKHSDAIRLFRKKGNSRNG
jgi:transcriptional regulator with XRE-family HTH domain